MNTTTIDYIYTHVEKNTYKKYDTNIYIRCVPAVEYPLFGKRRCSLRKFFRRLLSTIVYTDDVISANIKNIGGIIIGQTLRKVCRVLSATAFWVVCRRWRMLHDISCTSHKQHDNNTREPGSASRTKTTGSNSRGPCRSRASLSPGAGG